MARYRRAIHALLIMAVALVFAPAGRATSSQAPTHDPVSGANRVQLEGARNLRDLGGYRTVDGRVLKPACCTDRIHYRT
ncbi:MAG: hypothetical protein KBG75_13045 [Pseudomonadales bacterium]|nr:hypothetical protein [Pseudomonadales bacterium]